MASCPAAKPTKLKPGPYKPTLIIHGGAGNISRDNLPPELYAEYHKSLHSYLTSTNDLLNSDPGSAIDAACHAVSLMEDDPLFNCGRGSVFTSSGEIEMEASLAVTCIDEDIESVTFEGAVKRSAAVSMVRNTRHPILLAREILKMGDGDGGLGGTGEMHGHLSGADVENWGWGKGLEKKGNEWFWTKKRWEEHKRGLRQDPVLLREPTMLKEPSADLNDGGGDDYEGRPHSLGVANDEPIFSDTFAHLLNVVELPSQGTVGAVCMDSFGVIAVATSTGGLTNKRPGRIGDTPTVGAGFWAESWNESVASDSQSGHSRFREPTSLSGKLTALAVSGWGFWLGDCNGPSQQQRFVHCREAAVPSAYPIEKQSFIHKPLKMVYPVSQSISRRAVAMSGTGNGDSFLRTNACRTAAAMVRFSSISAPTSLVDAIRSVAGPDGELQRSAKDRWARTGEGEGGIIGVELLRKANGEQRGTAVFDFNCGGLWRAYFEEGNDGQEIPRVMVFKDAY